MRLSSQITFLYFKELAEPAHFFEEVLGLPKVDDQGFARIYRISGGAFIGIVDEAQGYCDAPAAKNVLITLVTDDVHQWYARLQAAGVAIDAVVDIDVPDEEIIKRMGGRRVHLSSGRTYHVIFNPPKVEGKDDETGEDLIQRDDDQEETVRKRLDVYHAQTEPLIDYYKSWESSGEAGAPHYIRIEGVGKVNEIRDQIYSELDKLS